MIIRTLLCQNNYVINGPIGQYDNISDDIDIEMLIEESKKLELHYQKYLGVHIFRAMTSQEQQFGKFISILKNHLSTFVTKTP